MIIQKQPPLHLTYCLNVHPGESWADNLAAMRQHTLAIRDRVAPGKPFGLGLRLSRQAAETLSQPEPLAEFKAFLAGENLYAFTINGFPYGNFHGKPVKTEVYRPDWSTRERLDYTVMLARILAQLVPEGTDGSISTLPLGYHDLQAPPDKLAVNLAECAYALHGLRKEAVREIHVGLEPEPDCLLETTRDVIRFIDGPLLAHGVPHLASRLSCYKSEAEVILRRHIGICVDTCHLAIQFENLGDSIARLVKHGIRISKIQLSSALEVSPTPAARARLVEFLDPVYLHQVKSRGASPQLDSHPDLAEALESESDSDFATWRIHCHVPLYFEGDSELRSTACMMDSRFWKKVASAPVSHLEIETYTFNVLPPALQAGGLDSSIAREYEWVRGKCGLFSPCPQS